MAKPRLIILVRHAQSEGNTSKLEKGPGAGGIPGNFPPRSITNANVYPSLENRDIHQTIPDHRVKLTQEGWQQAYDAGRRLRKLLRADDTVQFFTSPYRRTRETTEGILATLTSDDPEPTPFKRNNIKVYEEPRLREQDFGNFQPCSAEMERMWQERADYGHFFYRIPNGESAADAYDRVSGFNESLWRQFGDDDFASVCVLVTHGLMSRVFLMKWYHFSVEYFEDLRNINHCEFLVMRKQESGKYILENKLRTWSELRRERALKEKEKEEAGGTIISKDKSKADKLLSAASPVQPRRWGGCPNGCNHDKNFKIRSGLADLVKRDGTSTHHNVPSTTSSSVTNGSGTTNGSSLSTRRPAARRFNSGAVDGGGPPEEAGPRIDITKAREEVVSSPDGTPSFISVDDRLRGQIKSPHMPPKPLLHVGRDFGGTYSGHNSRAGSDADSSEDERTRSRLARLKIPNGLGVNGASNGTANGTSGKREYSGMGRGTMANRLGDAPHNSDCEHSHDEHEHEHEHEHTCEHDHDHDCANDADMEDLDKAEKEDRSIEGSVY